MLGEKLLKFSSPIYHSTIFQIISADASKSDEHLRLRPKIVVNDTSVSSEIILSYKSCWERKQNLLEPSIIYKHQISRKADLDWDKIEKFMLPDVYIAFRCI